MRRRARRRLLSLLFLPVVPIAPVVAQTNESGPPPADGACTASEARAFDFWAGEWNVLNRQLRRSDGAWLVTGTATMKGHLVAGGCAFVEHWQGITAGGRTLGFSLRSYDPGTGQWTILLNWPRPDRASFSTIAGAFRHGRGEFYFDFVGADSAPTRGRFTFSDISSHSLRWDQAFSTDSGKSWLTTWIMEFSRRAPGALPLVNGPTPLGSDLVCTQPASRAMDFVTGEWIGIDSLAPSADSVVTLEAFPIIGGCASVIRLDRAGTNGRSIQRFQVQSYVASGAGGSARWEAYGVDSDSPALIKATGGKEGDTMIFTTAAGDHRRREHWIPGEGGQTLQLTVEESADGGRSYRTVRRVAFERRI